jgi:glycosyltransferase involved in cell wall biosynthesis
MERLKNLEETGAASVSGEQRVKILHVITALGRGGAENHLLELVRDQIRRGYQVAVAYLKPPAYWSEEMQRCGANVLHLGLERYGEIGPAVRLRRYLNDVRPDVVHAHLPPAELYARLALLGIPSAELPLVISKHNDEPFCGCVGEKLLGRWVSWRAQKLIAISDAVSKYMTGSALGVSAEKIEVIPYGIDPTPFESVSGDVRNAVRKDLGFSDTDVVVGFIGRLVPQKDIPSLIRGVQLFCRTHGSGRLLIVGVGPEEKRLRRIVQMSGMEDRVVWAGFREDVPEVIAAMDVLALCSRYEGFGLVLLEAMASRRPVLGTRISAIPEVVDDGTTGVLVAVGDPDAVADGLQRLSSQEARERMGEAGARRVKEKFSLSVMCTRTCALYGKVLSSKGTFGENALVEKNTRTRGGRTAT